jgi:hypothetical protein
MNKLCLKLQKCYILDNIVYDEYSHCINEKINILKPYYYMELFRTEYEKYSIILEYDINQNVLDTYNSLRQRQFIKEKQEIQLSNDIIELLCNNLFGFYNLDFLEEYSYNNKIKNLLIKYILDNKCIFGVVNSYYDLSNDTREIKLINDSEIINEIINHYSGNTQKNSMFYWIIYDTLDDILED